MRFIFRLEANETTGLGHSMRCLGLAQALLDKDYHCLLITLNTKEEDLRSWQEEKRQNQNLDIINLYTKSPPGNSEDQNITLKMIRQFNANWLILDNYNFSNNYLKALQQKSLYTLSFSDSIGPVLSSNIVLNQNVDISDNHQTTKNGTLFLRGSQYFLARRKLIELPKTTNKTKNAILVTLGGADINNLGYKVCEKLLKNINNDDIKITLACTSNKISFEKVETQMSKYENVLTLWKPDLLDIMANHNIAICAGGVTSLELASLGIASTILLTADNQHAGANALEHYGGTQIAKSLDDAVAKALNFINNPNHRIKTSEAAMGLIDGKGAQRVIKHIQEIKSHNHPLLSS